MSGMPGFHTREAVRVKVKKCEGGQCPEYRKFSVDPQITSFEVLQNLLAKAFDIKGEFTVSYLARDDEGGDTYLGLLSDWDLDAAFLSSSDPCLKLKVELKPFEEVKLRQLVVAAELANNSYPPNPCLEEWDVVTQADLSRTEAQTKQSITGTFLIQMEKTFSRFQKVLNIGPDSAHEAAKPPRPPLGDREFHSFLDPEGRLARPRDLRTSIYHGGVEPSLRKVVWKHLLNVYPEGLTGKQRLAYMKKKSAEYYRLRSAWKDLTDRNQVSDEMRFVTNMVRKDVLRTDRTHKFYAGADDNQNVVSLFNVLTTYALNHPAVSYCQGMSDLASPLLVTMKDEAHAYVGFCALMRRLGPNFRLDGAAMTLKFQHLSELLQHFDQTFYSYLRARGADDLLFCYRWLLLELKREFAFDDALRMLEVLWSSLTPAPPKDDLPLFEREFNSQSPQSPRLLAKENPYTKVRAIRKQNSAGSLHAQCANGNRSRRGSGAEDSTTTSDDYCPISTPITRELRMELENLNRRLPAPLFGQAEHFTFDSMDEATGEPRASRREEDGKPRLLVQQDVIGEEAADEERNSSWASDDLSAGEHIHRAGRDRETARTPDEQCDLEPDPPELPQGGEILENDDDDGMPCPHLKSVIPIHVVHSPVKEDRKHKSSRRHRRCSSDSDDSETQLLPRPSNNTSDGYASEEAVSSKETSTETCVLDSGVVNHYSCEEAVEYGNKPSGPLPPLPGPQDLGGGNPFMMFLCLTLLLQHRDVIMRNNMDYNELAMHFDKMVRKHNLQRVLHQTRTLFEEYRRMAWRSEGRHEQSDATDDLHV
ncbi:TBC1 domain family member 25-like isoform X2 [Ornithodoros turicata]|uniref:TBC1 domain family member 25-like isoform X2 n=1 Tax=Ornithodoros turicata TaxID=34597 RepID=UPI003138C387